MRALVWHGREDVRIDNVPDPKIEKMMASSSSRSPRRRSAVPASISTTATSRPWSKATSPDMSRWAKWSKPAPGRWAGTLQDFRDKEDGCIKIVLKT